VQPHKKDEIPPVTRVRNITQPTVTVHLAEKPSGAGVVILPGGGFGKVVVDKEGTEAADWLNRSGVSAFVLCYRTKSGDDPGWTRPLQDAQRTMALVRSQPDRIGLLGFSAGGQVAARLLCDQGKLAYDRIDATDDLSHRPDFALLIYPWKLYDPKRGELIDSLETSQHCPPTFLVHTDDDASSSLGSALFYAGLKRQRVPAELHIYTNGGHGYGLRPVEGSQISTWPARAEDWFHTRRLIQNRSAREPL
jgi:acetyl esterase/lipase